MAEEKKKRRQKTKAFYDWATTGIPVIKLKDEEVEIEMTGSQVKHEAPGTNTFKMAEMEANDQ